MAIKYKETSIKGYHPRYTQEVFIVSQILKPDFPITFRIKNKNAKFIKGSVHEYETVK